MLEFAEQVLHKVRKLRHETQQLVVSGSVRDMEQYKFLMGRIEGFNFVEEEIKTLIQHSKELV
jgi:hypothetical protein